MSYTFYRPKILQFILNLIPSITPGREISIGKENDGTAYICVKIHNFDNDYGGMCLKLEDWGGSLDDPLVIAHITEIIETAGKRD